MDALNRIILRLLSKSLSLPDAQQALLSVLNSELLQKAGRFSGRACWCRCWVVCSTAVPPGWLPV
jgi:hypothetical protein